ncbi:MULTISPECIES: hypothetical protein [unclassified Microcoleus]|nr:MULTISPECIES: hypothetical protein [unclassified Microcoleus]
MKTFECGRKKEEGRRKKEEGRRKKEEGRRKALVIAARAQIHCNGFSN